MVNDKTGPEPRGRQRFETTNWKVVLEAGRGSREALTTLCATYWHSIYTFYRRTRSAEEAFDLTQGFFVRLLEKGDVAAADPVRGRFRNWLLQAAKAYRANAERTARVEKRGTVIECISIDAGKAEERYRRELLDNATPEQSYERRWARTLLERVMHLLRDEYAKRDQGPLFEKLARCLVGENEQQYREMAEELGMTEGTFRLKVHCCKARYGELLAEEVAATVSTDDDIEEELLFLREVLRSR